MGWLHRTRLWYIIAAAYLVLAAALSFRSAVPLTPAQYMLRVLAAGATSANVLISDGYHNGDKRGGDGYTPKAETTWLRWDYVGISSVLSTQYWLWGSNLGWGMRLRSLGVLSGLSTAAIGALSRFVVPQKEGHTAVKCIMALQFTAMFGYLVWVATHAAPAACAVNSLIYWAYAPGLIMYALKRPKRLDFGFHEAFHTSVLVGHVSSMLLDLKDLISPCARCALALASGGVSSC